MFESLRPFASPQPLGTRRIVPSSRKLPVQTAGVTWGAAGALPTPVESDADQPATGVNFTVKKETQKYKEKSRQVEQIRVPISDADGDPHVMVERVKKISFGQDKPPILKSLSSIPGTTAMAPGPFKANVPGPGETALPPSNYSGKETPIQFDPTEYTLNPEGATIIPAS